MKSNPELNDESGIYFFLREDENGFRFAYIGQAVKILTRLASHMTGYEQHIDLSLRKHKLYDEHNNPYGWRVEFLNFPESELDEREKHFIKLYADTGYQLRNVSLGGQGENRASGSIGERKAPKGYMQGIQQGKKYWQGNYPISQKSTLKSKLERIRLAIRYRRNSIRSLWSY